MNPEDLLELKTFEQIRDDTIAELQTNKFRITNFRPGRVFYTLVELSAKAVDSLYKLLAKVLLMLFLDTSEDEWLDLVAADRAGVFRKLPQQAIWNVIVGRNDISIKAVILPDTIVKTEEDSNGNVLRYLTTTRTTLDPGVEEKTLQVKAEFGGSQYNVGSGQINQFEKLIPGVDWVSNDVDGLVQEGTDRESNNILRIRAQNKNISRAYGGNDYMYISMAEEIVGVAKARVDKNQPRGQGTINAVIIGTNGVPSQSVIDQVVAKYDQDGSAIADIAVYACEPVIVPVTVILYKSTKRGNADTMKTQAEELIRKMFDPITSQDSPQFDLDYGVDRSLLMALRWFVSDVLSVDVPEPAADVKVTFTELATLGLLTVTVQEV